MLELNILWPWKYGRPFLVHSVVFVLCKANFLFNNCRKYFLFVIYIVLITYKVDGIHCVYIICIYGGVWGGGVVIQVPSPMYLEIIQYSPFIHTKEIFLSFSLTYTKNCTVNSSSKKCKNYFFLCLLRLVWYVNICIVYIKNVSILLFLL